MIALWISLAVLSDAGQPLVDAASPAKEAPLRMLTERVGKRTFGEVLDDRSLAQELHLPLRRVDLPTDKRTRVSHQADPRPGADGGKRRPPGTSEVVRQLARLTAEPRLACAQRSKRRSSGYW